MLVTVNACAGVLTPIGVATKLNVAFGANAAAQVVDCSAATLTHKPVQVAPRPRRGCRPDWPTRSGLRAVQHQVDGAGGCLRIN